MARKYAVLAVLGFFVLSLGGCASARKKKDLETQGLKNQISVLESQVSSKDEEINVLRTALAEEKEASIRSASLSVSETKSRPSPKQIQAALQNAGYYSGNIDGKLGKQSREAIKAFQKANNLPEDGKVGKKTWSILKDYIGQKVK
jgi:peptidoglycan hydrolase-like protein with peptidoglycan-binding domain